MSRCCCESSGIKERHGTGEGANTEGGPGYLIFGLKICPCRRLDHFMRGFVCGYWEGRHAFWVLGGDNSKYFEHVRQQASE